MRNDRLILSLIRKGELTADLETGEVYYKGRARGYAREPGGYIRFAIYRDGRRRMLRRNRIVWIAGTGKLPPYGMEVDHIDTDKQNDRFTNLELLTGAVNTRRAHDNGLCTYTERRRDPVTGKFIADMEAPPF